MHEELDEMGPIDYVVIEWPGGRPTGEAAPLLVDLVDRGLIRVMDLAFIRKTEDGEVEPLDVSALATEVDGLSELIGASSGLLSPEDVDAAATALDPGSAAGILSLLVVAPGPATAVPAMAATRASKLPWSFCQKRVAENRLRVNPSRLTLGQAT
jgi:Family of unknown function (DUF6325)